MNTSLSLAEAWQVLGLEPDAGFVAVNHAYKELKGLYGCRGLATYSLLNDGDCSQELDRVEEAYRLLSTHYSHVTQPEGDGQTVDVRCFHVDSGVTPAEFLRQSRERGGLSIQTIAAQSKIGSTHLENIEAERFDRLPAPVYLRGFIVEFARQLGVSNPEELTREYLRRMSS